MNVRPRANLIFINMFDLKVINSVLEQLEEERSIPREKIIEAIESALATAYKKEYGKKGQIIKAEFDLNTGDTKFFQVKIVVDETKVITEEEMAKMEEDGREIEESDERLRYNPDHHIMMEDAKKIKKDAVLDEEIIFELESKSDYGRIAAQTAKQVIIQKIREAEKVSVLEEYGKRQGEIVSGAVQRIERGSIYVNLGRTNAVLPFEEQIPGERYKQGERVRAYLYSVEESPRGIFLRLSRSHPKFLHALFKMETPEIASGVVEIKAIAREAGSRSKIAVYSNDQHIDPVGSMVGQRGVRVSTVMSELGGEKIDIVEWSAEPKKFIEDALSPAKVISVEIDERDKKGSVKVAEDQQSLAIGKGGQNVRLAAKLTGWRIDIQSMKGEEIATDQPGLDDLDKEINKEVNEIDKKDKIDEKVTAPRDESPVLEKKSKRKRTEKKTEKKDDL